MLVCFFVYEYEIFHALRHKNPFLGTLLHSLLFSNLLIFIVHVDLSLFMVGNSHDLKYIFFRFHLDITKKHETFISKSLDTVYLENALLLGCYRNFTHIITKSFKNVLIKIQSFGKY